jgi:SAM-dependent methyltransferase
MWDQRFGEPGFAYGTEPNDFLRSVVNRLSRSAPVLCIGEGEGRNAVFLAQQGLKVTAVDSSAVGLAKARDLAGERGVTIETVHADLADFDLGTGRWGAVVEIFCHMPEPLRSEVHRRVVSALAPGGAFVLEAYTPAQLDYRTGGPPVLERLYDRESVTDALSGLELAHVEELVREIREGKYHNGPGAVLQVLAVKPG